MIYDFPKLDLHLHLDGSFRLETLWDLAQKQKVKLPGDTIEEYQKFLFDCSNAENVNQYLKMFDDPLKVMQDRDSLILITKELIEDLAKQGLAYAEIRFAPQLHTAKGMSMEEAVEAVLEGRKQGMKANPSIKIGIITCMMSVGDDQVNYKENDQTIDVCKKYLGKGVVALDLAGAEGIVPLSNFGPLFARARALDLPIICHAGDSQGPDTVRDAIDFQVTRIGHGHHVYDDPELTRELIKKGIALEICPTSNIQCKTQPSYPKHPAKNLLDQGAKVTINTDNMTLARVTLDDEYDHCLNEMGFDYNDLIQVNINSVEASFMPEEDKKAIIKKLKTFIR